MRSSASPKHFIHLFSLLSCYVYFFSWPKMQSDLEKGKELYIIRGERPLTNSKAIGGPHQFL